MAPPPRHQQASVVLGYDQVEYTTSNTVRNDAVVKGMPSQIRAVPCKNKDGNVVFGEPGKKRDFITSSTQADPTGELHKYTAKLDPEDKKMLTKTSSSYGTDPLNYVTSTQIATHYDKVSAQETIALRNEIRKRTGPRPTRGMSYDDEIEYISETKSAFENKFKNYKPSIMAEAVKNDLRATHFTVGYEKPDYSTSSHIERLSPKDFTKYATRQQPLHDLKKSTVEIS
ncbi:hypothetical protein Poli38472_001533 [Pythium oligandrum]|uniref:Uncharacterized protein n=1 Tax=Pythium oligandrum TaxID=41045 RepID=A0A8K1FRV2_PYTOL|nr:hypothetical protein Poli38472_001533 [Pythium oligandrum]|eukprot:TMW69377.1 hypothetical protein Poli38472_001533 [Pythium oligandrum]